MNGHEIRANGLPTHMQRMPDKHSKVSKKDGSSYRTATVTLFYIEWTLMPRLTYRSTSTWNT